MNPQQQAAQHVSQQLQSGKRKVVQSRMNGITGNSQTMERTATSSSATGQSSTANRRPMNAFLLFCKRHRTIVKEKHPHLENRLISKILGEWWTSLDPAEKSKFNKLATEYKEHIMREQPNFSYNKKQQQQQVPVTAYQPASTNSSSSSCVKPNVPNATTGITCSTSVSGNGLTAEKQFSEQRGSQVHLVQLQHRTGVGEPSRKHPSSGVHENSSGSNSRVVSRVSSSASSPAEPRSPVEGVTACSNSNTGGVNINVSAEAEKDGDAPPKTMLHFKKRYLAAEKAKIASSNSTTNSSSSCSPKNKQDQLDNAGGRNKSSDAEGNRGKASEEACEALLQLAGSGQGHAAKNIPGLANSRSRSGTSSPTEFSANTASGTTSDQIEALKEQSNGSSNGSRYKVQRQDQAGVREAVLTRIAKTLLMQQDATAKEQSDEGAQGDKPINLSTSSHLQIHGQTIIEHVIENILDKPSEFDDLNIKRISEHNSKEGSKSPSDRNNSNLSEGINHTNTALVNGVGIKGNNLDASSGQRIHNGDGNYNSVSDVTEEEVKERIYESLKQDIMRRNAEKSSSEEIDEQTKLRWKSLPHQSITSTQHPKQQQTHVVKGGLFSSLPAHSATDSSSANNDSAVTTVSTSDLNQQPTQSVPITSNSSVTNETKPDHTQPVVSQKQLSGISVTKPAYGPNAHISASQLSEPTLHHQQQLKVLTTSATPGHATIHVPSIRNNHQQPQVSVTLVEASGATGHVQAYGTSKRVPAISSDTSYQIQVQEAHANDVPLNLSTTPPQTPAGNSSGVTITASPAKRTRLLTDEGDDVQEVQHQRNERACKGRRYQEFKDQALGRKGARNSRHRSGDRSSLDGNEIPSNLNLDPINTADLVNQGDVPDQFVDDQHKLKILPPVQQNPQAGTVISSKPFDVEKELNAIPALSLEVFQQKILHSRQHQAHAHGRTTSISPTQGAVSVSLTPATIVATHPLGVGIAGPPISQGSMAIVTTQSSPAVSYHPQQTIVVTKQPPNGKIVTTAGPPLTVIGSKRPLPQTSSTIPSVVPVITATAISSFQHVPQEQHQMQLQQHVGRGGGKYSKRITTVAGSQES